MYPEDPLLATMKIMKHKYYGGRSLLMLSDSFKTQQATSHTETAPEYQQLNLLANNVSNLMTRKLFFQNYHGCVFFRWTLIRIQYACLSQVSVPAASRTVYYCSLIKIPTVNQKRHVITVCHYNAGNCFCILLAILGAREEKRSPLPKELLEYYLEFFCM